MRWLDQIIAGKGSSSNFFFYFLNFTPFPREIDDKSPLQILKQEDLSWGFSAKSSPDHEDPNDDALKL
jgi:hypothetical protein